MNDFSIHLLAIAGTLIYVATAIPALVTVLRNRSAEAISPITLDLMILSGVWWVVYSADIDNVPSMISSGLALCSPLIILVLQLREGLVPWTSFVILGVGLATMIFFEFDSVRDLGLIAACFSLLIVVPTAWKVLVRRQPAPHASKGFWLLQAAGAAVWFLYGMEIGHPILGLTGVVVAPISLMILLQVRRAPGEPELEAA